MNESAPSSMPGDPPEGRRGRVFRRRVFYIPGYDPIHPRRYRELYRKEGAAQAALSGYAMELRPKKLRGPYGWHVRAELEGRSVETDVEVLVWSDIVKDSMDQGIPGTYLQLLRTAWAYIGSGALCRLMRLRRGPVIAALYPIAVLLAQLAAALALAGLLWWAGAVWLHWLPGLAAGLTAAAALLWWFRRIDGRIFAYYLMHDYAFTASLHGAYPPQLEDRLARFTDRLSDALAQDWDEVLVVGHSSGAYLAVSMVADLIRRGTPAGPSLSLLTLGHVVPMASFLPQAQRLRADLAFLSECPTLFWLDVTAPGDPCSFALCDPVAVTGVAGPGQRWPLVLSAAFSQTLSPRQQKALRCRWFRLHLQYLCAFDRPGAYDYFAITAGPRGLADRFAGRGHSPGRIITPAGPGLP